MLFKGVADSSNSGNVHSHILQESRSYTHFVWCGFAGHSRSFNPSPGKALVYSWTLLWELGLLSAGFSAVAYLSPFCPWGTVLTRSQVSRPLFLHSRTMEGREKVVPCGTCEAQQEEGVRGWPEHHFWDGSLKRALALASLTWCLVKTKIWSG